jgi:glycosyltransferase involved in cell wall biosynthesis
MKKKIIFTVINDLVYDRRMIRIGESLATEGYEVLLVGRKLKDSQPFINQCIKHKRFNLYFNKGKFFYIEYNIRLFFWLLFQRFDIICGIDLDTILPCYFASILRGGKPCVYDAHELFTEVPEVIRRPFTRKIWLWVEGFVVPKIKYKYTVSESVADEFFRRYKSRFEVIRNLPNFTEPSPPPTSIHSLPVILYQGNLNEGRGLETAVQAMQYIENAVFWIAGDGGTKSYIFRICAAQRFGFCYSKGNHRHTCFRRQRSQLSIFFSQ